MKTRSHSDSLSHWECDQFPWSLDCHRILRESFHLDDYRPLQKSALNALLSGEDVLLVQGTGSGKSLCYQLPAVFWQGTRSLDLAFSTCIRDLQAWCWSSPRWSL